MFGQDIEDVIGLEVKQLLDKAYQKAQAILRENTDRLQAIAELLLQKETITAKEFEEFF